MDTAKSIEVHRPQSSRSQSTARRGPTACVNVSSARCKKSNCCFRYVKLAHHVNGGLAEQTLVCQACNISGDGVAFPNTSLWGLESGDLCKQQGQASAAIVAAHKTMDAAVCRNKHLAERVQLEKFRRFVCLAHLHRRHIDLGTDIASSNQCLESVLVTRRRPQLECCHDCTGQ